MSLFIRLGMKSGGQADGSSKKAAKLRPKERGELLQVSRDECPHWRTRTGKFEGTTKHFFGISMGPL